MITESTVYWILKLDDFRDACMLVGLLSALTAFGSFIAWCCSAASEDDPQVPRSICFKTITVFVLCVVVGLLVPSTKQMAMIKLIPMLANSEVVSSLPKDANDLYKLGIEAIKEQLTRKDNK
jgi:hypothetical protein